MDKKNNNVEDDLLVKVEQQAKKKIRAKKLGKRRMSGFAYFGVVGWLIVMPTLLGIFIGIFLDKNIKTSFSWTVMFIFIGVIVGSINTWRWLNENSKD